MAKVQGLCTGFGFSQNSSLWAKLLLLISESVQLLSYRQEFSMIAILKVVDTQKSSRGFLFLLITFQLHCDFSPLCTRMSL